MSWRDLLLPAAFRGVPFFYQDTEFEGGRRLANHEFPKRETGYIKDLGKRNRQYNITSYVLDDEDYFTARDALISALEEEGSATLDHPYLGPLTVNIEKFRMHETRAEGAMARFEITAFDAGDNPSPESSDDTQDESDEASDDADDENEDDFENEWDGSSDPNFGQDLLGELFDTLELLLETPGIDITGLLVLIETITSDVVDAAAIAVAVTAFCKGYARAAAAANAAPFDDTQSSRGPAALPDPTYGLAALASWGDTLDPPVGARRKKMQAALVALVEGSAASGVSRVYAAKQFAAQEDAEAARDQVTDLVDGLATDAADNGRNGVYAAYQALQAAASRDLTIRGKQVPPTIDYAVNAVLPSLVLAQRFYDDAGRAGELVARNAAPHPLFMPPSIEALAA